jgi:hypothetical protein
MGASIEQGRAYVQAGLLLIAFATIGSATLQLLGGAHPTPVVARTIIVLILLKPVYHGKAVAGWILGVIALAGIIGVIVGIIRVQANLGAVAILGLEGAGFVLGMVLVYGMRASRVFRGRLARAASQAPSSDAV